MKNSKQSDGGRAAAGGVRFEFQIAAYYCTQILAQEHGTPQIDLGGDVYPVFVKMQSGEEMDDVLVCLTNASNPGSDGGHLFIQAKKGLRMDKQFRGALEQAIRQYCSTDHSGDERWNRAPDPDRDRFVIATNQKASGPVSPTLREQLLRHASESEGAFKGNESWRKLLGQVDEQWIKVAGGKPKEKERARFLSMLRIAQFDFGEGDPQFKEVIQLMKSVIVQSPTDASSAWSRVVDLCSDLNQSGGGTDLLKLRNFLKKSPVGLKGTPSFSEDYEKLRAHTSHTLSRLARYSEIRLAQSEAAPIKISRAVADTLSELTAEGSRPLLVLGEPGAGKSGALYEIATRLQSLKREVVVLAVDEIAHSSKEEIEQAHLRLKNKLGEVLRNGPGTSGGVLVTDALDAARDPKVERAVLELLEDVVEIAPEWVVVASARTFAARNNSRLRALFKGSPSAEAMLEGEPNLRGVRHIAIPLLTETELKSVAESYQPLNEILDALGDDRGFLKLLKVPFNLKIAIELIENGYGIAEVSGLHTQVRLLDSYWDFRLQGDPALAPQAGEDEVTALKRRARFLKQMVSLMIANHRFHIGYTEAIEDGVDQSTISEIQKSGILLESKSDIEAGEELPRIEFSHHIVFDYAVFRLLLKGSESKLRERLVGDFGFLVSYAPSIRFNWIHLWHADDDRNEFWKRALSVAGDGDLPSLARLFVTSVAAGSATTLRDLEPLLSQFKLDSPPAAAENLIAPLLASVQLEETKTIEGRSAVFEGRIKVWIGFLEQLSEHPAHLPAYAHSLFFRISDRLRLHGTEGEPEPINLVGDQLQEFGEVARRYFDLQWCDGERSRGSFEIVLQAVCRTFSSHPSESKKRIKKCFASDDLQNNGYYTIPAIAEELPSFATKGPSLAEELYKVASEYRVEGDDRVDIGGRIMPMNISKKDEYGSASLHFERYTPTFLKIFPEIAACCIARMRAAGWVRYQEQADGIEQNYTTIADLDFLGARTKVISDYSGAFGFCVEGRSHILWHQLEAYLKETATASDTTTFESIARAILSSQKEILPLAYFWSRLMLIAAEHPTSVGKLFLPTLSTKEFYYHLDLRHATGELLRSVFPQVNDTEKKSIEETIVNFGEGLEKGHTAAVERRQGELLLDCLSGQDLVTTAAKELRKSCAKKQAQKKSAGSVEPLKNAPPPTFEFEEHEPSQSEMFAGTGADVTAPQNATVVSILESLDSAKPAEIPSYSPDRIGSLWEQTNELVAALTGGHAETIDCNVASYGWAKALEATESAILNPSIRDDADSLALGKATLLLPFANQANSAQPKAGEIKSMFFTSQEGLKMIAARGLMRLAARKDSLDDEILQVILELLDAESRLLRGQIAQSAHWLKDSAPDSMWAILESDKVVGENLLVTTSALRSAANLLDDPLSRERIVALCERGHLLIANDAASENESARHSELAASVVSIWMQLAIGYGDEACMSRLEEMTNGLPETSREAAAIVQYGRDLLHKIFVAGDEPFGTKTYRLLGQIASNLKQEYDDLQCLFTENDQSLDDEGTHRYQTAIHLADNIVNSLIFASGEHPNGKTMWHVPESPNEFTNFLKEAWPTLLPLSKFLQPSITHHLSEVLMHCVSGDPKSVFLLVSEMLVNASEGMRFQNESMAARALVPFVESFIAEHGEVIRDNKECEKALMDVLTVFSQWPNICKIVYRLHEIYR